MPVTQGRLGRVSIGGATYPVYDWAMGSPRNIQQGMPVGNTWATCFGEGLQSTRFTARFQCREKSTEVLSTTFWGYWLNRTFGSGFDDTAGLTIIAGNGRREYTIANAKAEALSLTIAKGAIVGITGTFLTPGKPSKADTVTATTYANTFDNSPLLMFDKASFGGVTGSVYGFTMTYSNNHLPNGPLDGTKVLSAWEAGAMSCGASITMAEWVNASPPFSDEATLTVALNATRTLTLKSCTINNPDDVGTNPGQVYKPIEVIVQGTSTVPPLAVA